MNMIVIPAVGHFSRQPAVADFPSTCRKAILVAPKIIEFAEAIRVSRLEWHSTIEEVSQ
jgi:hypothetical protein